MITNRKESIFHILPMCLIWILFAIPIESKTLEVSPSFTPTTTRFNTIQEAVNAASDLDVIEVYPGDYFENVSLQKKLTIRAIEGPVVTRVLGGGTAFYIGDNYDSSIEGFTISKVGDAIIIFEGYISNCIISGTVKGISAGPGTFISNCVLYNCSTGVYTSHKSYDVNVTNSIFLNNNIALKSDGTSLPPGPLSYFISTYNCFWGNNEDYYGVVHSDDLQMDPLFRNALDLANPDFRIQPTSPCIDKGNPALGNEDPDGTRNNIGVFGGPRSVNFWYGPLEGPAVRDLVADPPVIEKGMKFKVTGIAEVH